MIATEKVNPFDLREGDAIDLTPLLNDPAAYPWVWQPFGVDEQERQRAIETARLAADCEYAVVEAVEKADGGKVCVYTDQINITMPENQLVDRAVV